MSVRSVLKQREYGMNRMEKALLAYWTNAYIPIRQLLLIRGRGEW
ncbi:hypothetical protein [Paenibacillus xylanilyticus]